MAGSFSDVVASTRHAAQSLNRDQLRAADATLNLLEPFYGKPASAESGAAMAEARPILDSLGTTASDLGKVVQWLRQTKIPGLQAEGLRIGQNTRAERGLKSGVDEETALAAGDAYLKAGLQEWASNAAQAEREGNYEIAAQYERRTAAWFASKSAAERTIAGGYAVGSAAFTQHKGYSESWKSEAEKHDASAARLDALAAGRAGRQAPMADTAHEATLERARQRGAEEAIGLSKLFIRMAQSVCETRIRWALDR